jgi:hypothetical protein
VWQPHSDRVLPALACVGYDGSGFAILSAASQFNFSWKHHAPLCHPACPACRGTGAQRSGVRPVHPISRLLIQATTLPLSSRVCDFLIYAKSLSLNKIVIPTGAYPDFLLRGTVQDHVCGSP